MVMGKLVKNGESPYVNVRLIHKDIRVNINLNLTFLNQAHKYIQTSRVLTIFLASAENRRNLFRVLCIKCEDILR